MDYRPQPIDTSSVELSPEILDLVERLAANAHDDWVARLVASGWTAGPEIDDEQKTHPGLTAYEELPEHEKQSLRHNVQATLKAILANGYQVTLRSPVIWLHRARCRVQEENIAGWNSELKSVFQDATASQLTVSDVFSGFSNDEVQRIVLGVQWKSSTANGSHIVKIGTSSEVGTDFEGWKRCVLQGGMSSRILPDVSAHELPDDRFAVVYEDAYRILGTDPDAESPRWLETAVNWAIRDSKPDVLSVESVLTQVFGELDRCLYAGARSGTERAAEFYRTALKKAGRQTEMSALECWQFDTHLNRRRDALWLITSRDEPIKPQPRRYLDPVDFLTWALENGRVPETLAGRAHGDLHGRNVLVGVVRGTAQQPVVIDYGDMADDNLLVWDFVKLECELKTRIAPALFSEPGAREALSNVALLVRPPARNRQPALAGELQDAADCADRMEFAFQFEHVLNGMTARIISRHEAETPLSEERRRMTGHTALDKALCLLHRIRQEASLSLGYRLGRSQHWRDEYFFALCAYGVLKAKWDVEWPQLEWSLISAGVAAGQLSVASEIAVECETETPNPVSLPASLPSHLIPLAWAHRLWQKSHNDDACRLLRQSRERFPAAVTLNSELALCLAARGQDNDLRQAAEQVEELRSRCAVFGDEETLCRLARVYKNLGDIAWKDDPEKPGAAPFASQHHGGWQLYGSALKLYRDAFGIRHDFFPGINAATVAMLRGDQNEAEKLAESVLKTCSELDLLEEPDDPFWVYATEGEACLLLGRTADATQFYRHAITALRTGSQTGMLQSLYEQLCRLHWCLGPKAVQPVVDLFQDRGLLQGLEPGPFHDCGFH